MERKTLILKKEPGTAIVKFNRPEALNALNKEMLKELSQVIQEIEEDDTVRVVILTGEGKAFIAGADIKEMEAFTAAEAKTFSKTGQLLLRRIELMEKPVIAAVNGFALGGGCEMAMCCDIRIASEKAKFGQPEVNLGLIPGFAGTQRLTRLIGMAHAKELIFTADMIDAQTALQWGLITRIVAPDILLDEAKKLAQKILAKGPTAIKLAKSAINYGLQADMDTASAFESHAFSLCFATEEPAEGMRAFIEKRPPKFA